MEGEYSKKGHLKRILIVVLLIIAVIFLNSRIRSYSRKNKIFKMVTDNIELLNESVSSGEYDEAYKIKGIEDISTYRTSTGRLYIDYYCYGFGIVPSSIYYGFCYVAEDKPIGFQGTDVKLTKSGSGWAWQEPSGDNYCYTEKITDHWYYYEAGF